MCVQCVLYMECSAMVRRLTLVFGDRLHVGISHRPARPVYDGRNPGKQFKSATS